MLLQSDCQSDDSDSGQNHQRLFQKFRESLKNIFLNYIIIAGMPGYIITVKKNN